MDIKNLWASVAGVFTTKNARFTDPQLERVAAGTLVLKRGAKGPGVTAIQTALIDLGYVLPKHGADGGFGGETIFALKQFQKARGLTVSGMLDAATLRELEKVAPPPGEQSVLYPEYAEMLKDGVLSMTVGIGFDEDDSDLDAIAEMKAGFTARGFKEVHRGADTYFEKAFTFDGKPVRAEIKYVDRNTADARLSFIEGMKLTDVVMYGGHARYGSGPDFDTMESAKGNVVLGANAKGHKNGTLTPAYNAHILSVLKGQPNVLEKETLSKGYQLFFFHGCTTSNYLDELRALPKGKDASNLDTITSDEILYWHRTAPNLFVAIDSLMAGKSKNAVQKQLYEENVYDGKNVSFTADGFGGNKGR